jgi:hypothetical protein
VLKRLQSDAILSGPLATSLTHTNWSDVRASGAYGQRPGDAHAVRRGGCPPKPAWLISFIFCRKGAGRVFTQSILRMPTAHG